MKQNNLEGKIGGDEATLAVLPPTLKGAMNFLTSLLAEGLQTEQ